MQMVLSLRQGSLSLLFMHEKEFLTLHANLTIHRMKLSTLLLVHMNCIFRKGYDDMTCWLNKDLLMNTELGFLHFMVSM